jgi:hypothetical protein
MSLNTKRRRLGLAVLALALTLAGAACGSNANPPEPSPQPTPLPEPDLGASVEPDGFELALYVQRENTMLGLSVECYEFHSDGTVELRHGSTNFNGVSDTGLVNGDENSGQIDWESGRSSTYEWDGSDYRVDGALGAVIDSCLE